MIESRSHYCMLRMTLEAQSAHGIHSGRGDTTHDVLLVRDGNGLPTLPGSSIAGVLRHQYREHHGEAATNTLFGCLGEHSQPSWLTVTWGLVHDSQNRPHEELMPETNSARDPLLHHLLDSKPLIRQRVRLTHRGTAAAQGKFDNTLIPAGVRYTCWIGYWCDSSDPSRTQWDQLLDLLQQPGLRIGHGTRSGAGAFTVQSLHQARWDLRTPEGRVAYSNRPRSRATTTGLTPVISPSEVTGLHVKLALQAESGWRIGGGERPLNEMATHEKEPDMLPMHENRVVWHGNEGRVGIKHYIVPGSSIKGALRHRVAYHYRCLTGQFASNDIDAEADDCPAVTTLFGFAKDKDAGAGLLVVHDIFVDNTAKTQILMHNRIDRFTGGVIRGALFGEQVLWQTPLTLHIDLLSPAQREQVPLEIRQALQLALEDLSQGWLPLGAGGGRGLGVFTSPDSSGPQWSDNNIWVNGQSTKEAHACA